MYIFKSCKSPPCCSPLPAMASSPTFTVKSSQVCILRPYLNRITSYQQQVTFFAKTSMIFQLAQLHSSLFYYPLPPTFTISDGNQEHPLPFSQATLPLPAPLHGQCLLTLSLRPSCCCPFQATQATTAKTTSSASTWRKRRRVRGALRREAN